MLPQFLSLLLIAVFFSCSSGKKSFEKGDYDKAVLQAVNRLQKDPNNSKALSTLKHAFKYAEESHLTRIKHLAATSDLYRWEIIIQEYADLNNLNEAVRRCPSCREVVGANELYIEQLAQATQKAAEVRFAQGVKLLAAGDRMSARQAYENFERTEQLVPNFKDAKKQMEDAYWAAVLKVVVEPVEVRRGIYEISNDYFQNKIYEYLQHYERSSFIKFYTPQEVRNKQFVPDQVLTLSFDDFVVGQTYLKEKEQEVKRDSVKISSKDEKDIYSTVKAKYITFEKTISSSGLLDFRVMDWKTKNIVTQEKMPGTFVWQDTWATYKGDDRALTDAQRKMIKRRESPNPPPQTLFVEFTKPIYDQLTGKIRSFYRRY
ncbi:hypothetical protein [Adhaeribacter aquaticus]|uniref:hypothetical protein n=1 Tax=Adhaeribacter aquaticus TaxID=299567 RepID=UPI000418445F|nr:hypothetical protein [Adhaeribacter aquaticus]